MRITAQLIDASTDQHEWSQSFDRPLSTANLFAIQDEIAKSIVDHLAATMGSAADTVGPTAARQIRPMQTHTIYTSKAAAFLDRTTQNLIAAAEAAEKTRGESGAEDSDLEGEAKRREREGGGKRGTRGEAGRSAARAGGTGTRGRARPSTDAGRQTTRAGKTRNRAKRCLEST